MNSVTKDIQYPIRRIMNTLWQDLRYGVRALLKRPGITAAIVITLALSIGATTAIFSVVNAVLLRALPYPEADRLVWVGGNLRDKTNDAGITPGDLIDYREQNKSFAQFAASISDIIPVNLTENGEPERLKGAVVTSNYFDVFEVQPALGRTFLAEEEQEGRGEVVVLSYGLWKRRFAADPAIINKPITLDGKSFTIIGVMPAKFQYPAGAEFWQPINFPISFMKNRKFHFLRAVGRLKPGVTVAQAQAECDNISRQLETQYPQTNTDWSLHLKPLQERVVGNVKPTLLVLFGAIGCVLLIACANVANLLLARATSRQKEIAVRGALGASRFALVRQMLAESLMLSLLGGGAGVIIAVWGVDLLVAFSNGNLPRTDEIGIDHGVLVFGLAISLFSGLLFGIAPAWQASRVDLIDALKYSDRSARTGAARNRTRSMLVVAEVALAFVLLIGAGLLINSFLKLQEVNPGFDAQHVLTVRIDLSQPYAQPEQKAAFFEQLQQRVASLPGVETVGLVTELPLAKQSADVPFSVEGRAAPSLSQSASADLRSINHQYFRAMRIPLIKGRSFTEVEVHQNAPTVIISDALAERYFAGADPLGKRLLIEAVSPEPFEIVGIVGDVRHRGLDGDLRQTLYLPTLRTGWSNLVIRTATDPLSLAAAVRREVAAIDPNQPVTDVKTMEQWMSESVAEPRFRTLLLGVFSAVALLLAVVGIYGVISYSVVERTGEIGIRMALGAQGSDVLKMIVGVGFKLVALGLVIGLAGAVALTRLITTLLFGVAAKDPATFLCVALLLMIVSLLACYLPARRATKVDPLVALRYE